MLPLPDLILVLATFLFSGTVKGVLGLGMPVITMGVLGSVLPPVEAASLLLVPAMVTNVWQWAALPNVTTAIRRFGPMMAGVIPGGLIGSGLMAGPDARIAGAALGVVLAVYALVGLTNPRFHLPPKAERWAGPFAGLGTGLLAGATGVSALPCIPYLVSLRLGRDELVQALGLVFTASMVALAGGLAWRGALPLQLLGPSTLALAPAVAGMMLGGRLRRRVHPERFRSWFFVGLVLLGASIVIRSLA